MTAPDLAAALLAALDDQSIAQLAERLRPYLAAGPQRRPLLTPAEAAERLRLHPKTVVRMARDGRLPATKIGTGWRFHPDQLHITPKAVPVSIPPAYLAPRRPHRCSEPASVRAIRGDGGRG